MLLPLRFSDGRLIVATIRYARSFCAATRSLPRVWRRSGLRRSTESSICHESPVIVCGRSFPLMPDESPFRNVVVGLDASEAALMVHVLDTFERLLRQSDLTDEQLCLLVPPGTGTAGPSAQIEVANIVADVRELIERQR